MHNEQTAQQTNRLLKLSLAYGNQSVQQTQ